MLTDINTNYEFESFPKINSEKIHGADKTQTSQTGPVGDSFGDEWGHVIPPESALAYLDYLQSQFTDSIFTIGEYDSGFALNDFGEGVGNIMLSPQIVQRMMDDPEFEKQMKKTIGEIDKSERALADDLRASEVDVLSRGTMINADGSTRKWNFTVGEMRELEEAESTSAFLKMEELREKAMELSIEAHKEHKEY